jgi:hydrogenase expression/formation protein HypD
MKYLDAELDPGVAQSYLDRISEVVTRSWTIVEFSGGQARQFLRDGIDRLLPEGLRLRHGPGCPDGLIPVESIELAARIGDRPGTTLCTSSVDLLEIPGRSLRLSDVRARGRDIRVVYSPLAALALARGSPDREVVYLSVGFETTAPAASAAVLEAERLGLENFSMIVAHPRAVEVVRAVLVANQNRAQALLVPGHVSAVIGLCDYHQLAEEFGAPIVVTGPEPLDLLDGLARAVRQLEDGSARVENQYERAVREAGNPHALAAITRVFEPADVSWRGLGRLPASGLKLRERYRRFDACARYAQETMTCERISSVPCRDVLLGRIGPTECHEFGRRCSPEHAIGPAMLTAQGACAAYYSERGQLPVVEIANGRFQSKANDDLAEV